MATNMAGDSAALPHGAPAVPSGDVGGYETLKPVAPREALLQFGTLAIDLDQLVRAYQDIGETHD